MKNGLVHIIEEIKVRPSRRIMKGDATKES
jgi:hypothetical protein